MGGILMIASKLRLLKHILLSVVGLTVASLLCAGETHAQSVTPAYDVVSIKPAKSGGTAGSGLFGNGIEYTADGLRANSTVMSLIQSAYGVDADRISGAQGWITSEKFSIDAKMKSPLANEIKKL